jgi:NADH-quinone oxidoreductase subunit J
MDEKILFYIFTSIALFAAGGVVFSKDLVREVLYLITLFIATAVIWLLLKAEFLAFLLILIYVGAVVILFLFIIMIFDLKLNSNDKQFNLFTIFGIIITSLLSGILIYVISLNDFNIKDFTTVITQITSSRAIIQFGELLFTKYLFPVAIAGLLLLAAIVAAIGLTIKERKKLRTTK